MNKGQRAILVLFSLILSVVSVILLAGFFNNKFYSIIAISLSNLVTDSVFRWLFFAGLLIIIGLSVVVISSAVLSGRLSRTRIRQTDIGYVDIGVDAIESIALNSAKSAQVGIKSAKAHASSGKDDAIRIHLNAVLYSNVEVPAMMAKVQERIKKDVERYTGISVESVTVKVSRVEPVVAKVER